MDTYRDLTVGKNIWQKFHHQSCRNETYISVGRHVLACIQKRTLLWPIMSLHVYRIVSLASPYTMPHIQPILHERPPQSPRARILTVTLFSVLSALL
jgi:hypothetical protein